MRAQDLRSYENCWDELKRMIDKGTVSNMYEVKLTMATLESILALNKEMEANEICNKNNMA